jgi:hypothetical protein
MHPSQLSSWQTTNAKPDGESEGQGSNDDYAKV